MSLTALLRVLTALAATPACASASSSDAPLAPLRYASTVGLAFSNANTTPSAGLSYAFTPQWQAEVWTTLGVMQTKVGRRPAAPLRHRPVSLMALYQFGHEETSLRPFIGLGYGRSAGHLAVPATPMGELKIGTLHGVATTVGCDLQLGPRWFVRTELRGLTTRARVTLNGARVSRFSGTAGAWGLSVGARF